MMVRKGLHIMELTLIKKLIGKFKCWRGKHDWGPKNRWDMYSYYEKCKREGCNAIMVDSCFVLMENKDGTYRRGR